MRKKEQKPDLEILQLLSAGKIKAILRPTKERKYMARNAEIILFDDGQTYLTLEEQDYYSYHDCAPSARHLEVRQDKEQWEWYLKEYIPATSLT